MRYPFPVLASCGSSILVGCLVAVTVVPINLIALTAWLLLAWFCYARLRMRLSVAVQFLGLALVLCGAWIAPVKTTQDVLRRIITFDRRQMSLEQLDAYVSSPENRQRLPVKVELAFAVDDKDMVIVLPSERISVADFIDSIQSQTKLRARFEHCGNGWTLLWGGDCCFGLFIVDSGLRGEHRRIQYRRYE